MTTRVTAQACANIALCKYWGKAGAGNVPATPSISLALDKLTTTTTVERSTTKSDHVIFNGKPADQATTKRVRDYLSVWRNLGLLEGQFKVTTENNFPTGAGLASSSSAFAALATALGGFSARKIGTARLSRLARIGSGSAARSVTGGISALPASADPASKVLFDASEVPWAMVVAVVDQTHKDTGSRSGMEQSRLTSPYYAAWIKQASADYKRMRTSLRSWNITEVGEIAEANMLAMHACMLATRPALTYWNGATLGLIQQVRVWRKQGLECYATTDAGANVAVLCSISDLPKLARRVGKISGVMKAIACKPGGGSEIIGAQ